jgi:hypothetical protein
MFDLVIIKYEIGYQYDVHSWNKLDPLKLYIKFPLNIFSLFDLLTSNLYVGSLYQDATWEN